MASVIASIAAVCVMTGGIGYQAAVSGAQTDSTESSVKDQNTDQQESTDGSFSEEGTTQIGTVSQMPEFTVNAVTMDTFYFSHLNNLFSTVIANTF